MGTEEVNTMLRARAMAVVMGMVGRDTSMTYMKLKKFYIRANKLRKGKHYGSGNSYCAGDDFGVGNGCGNSYGAGDDFGVGNGRGFGFGGGSIDDGSGDGDGDNSELIKHYTIKE
jgi:hypothetical protein